MLVNNYPEHVRGNNLRSSLLKRLFTAMSVYIFGKVSDKP